MSPPFNPNQPWIPDEHLDGRLSDGSPKDARSESPPFAWPGTTTARGILPRNGPAEGPERERPFIEASMAIPAIPGAGPFVLPPYAIPGSPENQIWTDHATRGLRGLLDLILKDSKNDACYDRYEEEVRRCEQSRWQVAHPDYTHGCKERARDRLNLCIRNGGTPNPDEPPEWTPGPDKDEETWRNFGR